MLNRLLHSVLMILLVVSSLNAAPSSVQTFAMKGVRSHEDYGPFPFRNGTLLKLESGIFRLNILADNKAFSLTDTESGLAYGVYELILGRMIDIGDVLFTITNVTTPPSVPVPTILPSVFDDTEFALEISLIDKVAYDWDINDTDSGTDDVERRNVTLKARKGLFAMQFGLITESDWANTIPGDNSTFIDAELANGSGWFAAAGLSIPVFQEGRWSALVHGETFYRREELALQYGTWEVASITSVVDTNAITNAVSTTTNLRFNNYSKTATLTETLVSIGARLDYHAPSWFLYTGIKALPWSDTSLDAVITSDDRKFKMQFERRDPVMAYGGIGLDIRGLRSYVEVMGGGEKAVQLGISRAF